MRILRDIIYPVLAFLAGAASLTLLANMQHRFATGAHSWKAFLVPVCVGGTVGSSFYFMKQRIRELSLQLHSLSITALSLGNYLPSHKRTSSVLLILSTTLGGCLFLSLLSVTQKVINGFPINPKGFIIPIPVGSMVGFLFGLYLNQLKQFQGFQTDALHTLAQQKSHLSNIIETIHDGILVTDAEKKIELVNPAGQSMLDTTLEKLQSEDLWTQLRQLTAPYQSDSFSIPPYNTSFLLQSRKTAKILRGSVSPLLNQEGKETGLVLAFQDMSYEKKIEHLKTEFISTATHELNTPISALAGYSELLLNGDFPKDQQKEFIETISHNAWQVSNILDDLLNIDSVGAPNQIILDKESYPITEIIKQIRECTEKASATHPLTLDIQSQKSELSIDMKRVKRIFCHLVDNACKFSAAGSPITIRGRTEKGYYLFEITDRGIGIDSESCKLVFDKFFKVDATDTAREGIGLGLSVVKTLVQAHDGKISIKSQPGEGTAVQFSLPLL